ncbi:MAG: hypothetical protein ACRDAX_02510 [Propionibacteriaceae bacterium]
MGFFDFFRKRRPEPEPIKVPSPPTEADILASLARVEALVSSGVPAAVTSRVHRISKTIRETLPRLNNDGLQSQDSYYLMTTATNYLPEALEAYLRLPRDWADSRPIDHGKSALLILVDQLDLLAITMERILDAISTADAAALIAHGRFLQDKFGAATPTAPLVIDNQSANPLDL